MKRGRTLEELIEKIKKKITKCEFLKEEENSEELRTEIKDQERPYDEESLPEYSFGFNC